MNHEQPTTNNLDIHQSPTYARYMFAIGWTVETVEGIHAFIKKLPFVGAVIKIQRPDKIPSEKSLQELKAKYQAKRITVEPSLNYEPRTTNHELLHDPYLPTKTIHIDLKLSKKNIFKRFTEAKRRAVRRAEKNNIVVRQSGDVQDFITLKNKSAGLLGFLTTTTVKPLFETFSPDHAAVLVAYRHCEPEGRSNLISNVIPAQAGIQKNKNWIPDPIRQAQGPEFIEGQVRDDNSPLTTHLPAEALAKAGDQKPTTRRLQPVTYHLKPVAAVLLLSFGHTAYYWQAAASSEGKKLAAPTLLVWEALKLAKNKKCTLFDFEGIYDGRYPNLNKNWSGFTKFKQGFGGVEVEFPKPFCV